MLRGETFYSQRKMVSGEYQWIPGDDSDKYVYHMKKKRSEMEYNGWDGDRANFTYKFNSYGFRSEEFTEEPSVMFLGCSMTMGVGIELELTWTYMVAKSLGLRNHNLGIGGGNNDGAFRMFDYYHRLFKPKIVIHYSPPNQRLEYFDHRNKIINMMPRSEWYDSHMYRTWLSNDLNSELNFQKNSLAIQHLCNMSDIKYFVFPHEQMFPTEHGFEYDPKEFGRDLLHPGAGWHRNMHKRIMENIS